MKKYTVVVEAYAPVYISIEVEADHPQDALLAAIERAILIRSTEFQQFCPPELVGYQIQEVQDPHVLTIRDENDYVFTICDEHLALARMKEQFSSY